MNDLATLAPPPAPAASLDVSQLGQVFTPPRIVQTMLSLRQRQGTVLEPSCGNGAFLAHLPGAVGIELDPRHAPPGVVIGDFFAYPETAGFDTIIGNPPYVRFQDVAAATRDLLPTALFDGRSNLYLFFIEKCLRHLAPGGELIFITPRDFLKATSACALNRKLYTLGTLTHALELGDRRSFADALPNCLIWRFERDNFSRRTAFLDAADFPSLEAALDAAMAGQWDNRFFEEAGGHLAFVREAHPVSLTDIFSVKVGAVSGADALFTDPVHGTRDFVCSHTQRSGQTRRMIWTPEAPPAALLPHKDALLARRITTFDETNWWHWGRGYPQTDAPRIYVNLRTRNPQPFFLHPCTHFDGSVLALFPHRQDADLAALCAQLNAVDWAQQGFVCDGRHIFSQRSLTHARLPGCFAQHIAPKP